MKKSFLTFVLLALCGFAFAQLQNAPQWNKVLSNSPETFRTQLISSSESNIRVNVQVPGFYTTNVTTPRGEAKIITMPKAVSTAKAGEPEMPMTGIPAIIGDQARMNIRVLDAQYMDFEGIEVAPSKGDFPRTIDPATVPYTYGECYSQDAFFPASNVGLYEPYIIRDFRGQNMVVYPYAYNPVSKTLRVYYNMTVEMYKVDNNGSNVMETRRSNTIKMDPDFKSVYQHHFINYQAAMNRYTPVDEDGDLLIICYDNFISSMTDFVNWKKTRGINTTIVGTSTAGTSYSAIKSYIQNQYNANNNLTHVLLVGDVAQIPGYTYSGASGYEGKGDNPYGQIVGNDIYNDLFIGRFSASSATQVTTQVTRTINYERDLTTSDTWCQNGLGISTSEGSGGHYNEDDYQHIENLRTDLLNFGYSTVYQDYYSVSGYPSSSTTTISNHINSGVGIINYCNHGQETGWQSHSPYYTNTYVNALTNNNKLPFIFSVACLVGKYDYSSGDCFAETWMHATNGSSSTPTGAIGGAFSYISQPWIPPMWAQDEFVDILVESYSNNIKRTLGGTMVNGMMAIFNNYSTSNASAVGTYQAWVVYGDPTLMMRTKTPQTMTVNHAGTIAPSASSYAVTVSNGSGAVATITDANHNILGKATVGSNGTTTINISGTLTVGTQLTLCVFGYNKVTYLGTISVVGGTQYTISATASPSNGGTVSGAGQYYENTQCTLTATPNTGYTFTNWKKGNNVVSTNTNYTFTVSSSTAGSYTATFTAIPQYTITATANPTNGGNVSGGGTFYSGTSCTLTATANTGYAFSKWTKNGTQVSTNPTYTFNVTAAGAYVANFDQLTAHSVTCNTPEGGTISANVSNAYPGDVVTLTATANTGYYFSLWDVRDANNNSITVSNNQFTMPNSNVTVSATFVQGCTVTIAQVEHGTVMASATNAAPGTTITLTATPETDYSLSSWLVYQTGDVRNIVAVSGNSFVLPAFDVTVIGIFKMNKEAEIAIGSGTNANQYLPTYAYYNYSLTQQIYTASEIGQAGTITKIAFKVSNSKSTTRTLDVYMKHTSKTAFTSNTGWETMSSSNKVFSGSVSFQSSGWTTITLTTPFEYNGTSNLVVCVDDNTGSYVSSSSNSPQFYVYSTGANRAIRYYNDNTNPNPASPSSVSGTYITSNNQVTFTMTTAGDDASLAVSPNVMSDFTYVEGEGPSAIQNFAVIGTDLNEAITVNAPEHFEISDEENGTYSNTLTIPVSSKGNRETLTYDFEDGTQGWTTLKGNTGNSPNNWHHNTTHVSYSSGTAHDWSSFGHNSSSGFMISESYISATSSSGTAYGAVTPDNYLVSPQVRLGGSISFYAGARNTDYCAEKFSVMVSTTDNTNTANFTTVATWTLSLSQVGYTSSPYTVDLSAYSGMGYIAIRHWDCNDQWVLCVDDITIAEGEGSSVDPTNPTVELLTANVYVRLKAGLTQGTYANETLTVSTGDITSNITLNGEVEQGNVTYYDINVNANPTEGGNVTGAGSYAEGTNVTLTATANEGYTFTNWTKNGTQVSSNATYTFTANESANYVANFTLNTYTITALVNPEDAGTVTGAGIYNHGEDVILTATANPGYTFVNWTENGDVVCVNATYVSNATADRTLVANFEVETVEQTITLNAGSYWWSTYLEITLEELEAALGSHVTSITSQTGNVSYLDNLGWDGDFDALDLAKMYKFEVNETFDLVLEGVVADPADHPITIKNGVNWIGYPVSQSMSIADALVNLTPTNGDIIKSKNSYSTYIGTNWFGTLKTLEPGQGYIYTSKYNGEKTFVYPNGTRGNAAIEKNITPENNLWKPASERFMDNMNVTAVVNLEGVELGGENIEVGAFVGDECRGSVKLMHVKETDQYVAFLTVHGHDGEMVSFRVFNDGNAIEVEETVEMRSDAIVGDLESPFVLHNGHSSLSLFPNPVERGGNVRLEIPANIDLKGARMEIYNATGALLMTEALTQKEMDITAMHASGIYTVKVCDRKGNVHYGKLIVR